MVFANNSPKQKGLALKILKKKSSMQPDPRQVYLKVNPTEQSSEQARIGLQS